MPNSALFYNWNQFFAIQLLESRAFRISDMFRKSDTQTVVFSALKGNPDTLIEVCCNTPKRLSYIHIFNPATPGKNRQQLLNNLCRYNFAPQNHCGPPGLDFTVINIQGIRKYLEEGFNGSETVYYRKGSPVKSRLTTSYCPHSSQRTATYHFHRQPLLERILNKVTSRKIEYDEVKTIDLQDIFCGLKRNIDINAFQL